MKVFAFMAEPGAGKTTLMRRIMKELGPFQEQFKKFPLVDYHQNGNMYVLGRYEEGELFAGTDRLSMAVQPQAVAFLESLSPDSVVFFEGDRLCNQSFLEHCLSKYAVEIMYLKVSKETREERFKERGSNQNEQFIRSRETKLGNLRSNFELQAVTTTFKNENIDDQDKIMDYIKGKV